MAEAKARWFAALEAGACFDASTEVLSTQDAFERIVVESVTTSRPVPHVRASAMDGIAVRAAETAQARIDQPLIFQREKDFVRVDTGDPLPENFDAVIMLEDLDFAGTDTVEFRKAAFPGQNVRPIGEDFSRSDTILKARAKVTPEAVAACLAADVLQLKVLQQPKVFVILTGTELAASTHDLPAGKYPETNSALFTGYLRRWAAKPTLHPLIKDDEAQIKSALQQGLEDHDMILINAGTSKGREDFTTSIIEQLGDVLVHGVSMHPGHPVVLGVIQNKPVIGVPGYPVATWITLDQFVLPFLEKYYGCPLQPRHTVTGKLARRVHSPLGEIEFIRVRLERIEENFIVHQLAGKASSLSSLINADGLLKVSEELSGYQKGEGVKIRLL